MKIAFPSILAKQTERKGVQIEIPLSWKMNRLQRLPYQIP
jgi:hypothetical protein